MLAFVLPTVLAVLMLGKIRALLAIVAVALVLFAAAYAVEASLTEYRPAQYTAERSLSARQLADNVASIFGQSGRQTEDTKQWRLDWWNIIVDDTVYGPHFWTGRGFGLNLADADGFRDGDHPDAPALRSPHNVHMTLLARAGVPGAVLWVSLTVSWFWMLLVALLTARRRGQIEWAGLFLFIGSYVMAALINATFDVALEGPMQGVWFWSLLGLGIGSVMVYRCQPREVTCAQVGDAKRC
jgi:hypothetical protein